MIEQSVKLICDFCGGELDAVEYLKNKDKVFCCKRCVERYSLNKQKEDCFQSISSL